MYENSNDSPNAIPFLANNGDQCEDGTKHRAANDSKRNNEGPRWNHPFHPAFPRAIIRCPKDANAIAEHKGPDGQTPKASWFQFLIVLCDIKCFDRRLPYFF